MDEIEIKAKNIKLLKSKSDVSKNMVPDEIHTKI